MIAFVLVYYFLIYFITTMHVNVWCIENEKFEGFSKGEDFEDS
jgi:hypothetical protein